MYLQGRRFQRRFAQVYERANGVVPSNAISVTCKEITHTFGDAILVGSVACRVGHGTSPLADGPDPFPQVFAGQMELGSVEI